MSHLHRNDPQPARDTSLTESGFEKKGGYLSPASNWKPEDLPEMPTGPAPGALVADSDSGSGEQSGSGGSSNSGQ
jgi:hypothetical protein